ncbi:CDP-alcohol phosphatidyltransferase family protein [Sphingomonas parva]|uniref:CDP-alcohol phosphatidyltransferase family protein n=1 Tax=Sphingomonas parva TaxID=2555898 RepID=UPI001CDCB610|nr:CDP-alcohol phosphatidyltransferase family protein [Sphingomonas parva]
MLKARPVELEDWLNRSIYHPLSRRIALALQHTPVTPNMISITSGLSIVAATACYTLVEGPLGIALGLFFHVLWHVIDGADGDLARLTGKSSPVGEMIDGLCDYVGHIILYTALAFHAGGWAWWAAAFAAASRILQANHIESVRRTYLWRAYGVPWLRQSKSGVAARRSVAAILLAPVAAVYVGLAGLLIPRSAQADALVERLEAAPATREQARSVSRQVGRRALAWQVPLGANLRTLFLGASMALGSPGWFFLFEATALNVLLAASIVRQRRVNKDLTQALEQVAGR